MKKLPIQILLLLLLSATLCFAQDWANLVTPQHIHEIYEIDTKLYCATEGGLVIYDQATQIVERQFITDDIPSHRVEDITQDGAGNIWIGTYDNGLARMTDDGWEKLPIEHNLSSHPLTYSTEYDNNGTLWVGTLFGLFKYENNTWTQETTSTIWDMEKDDQGIIYTGGVEPGRLENGVLTQYNSWEHGFMNTYRFSHIDYGPNGSFYWASGEAEVVIYDGNTWTTYDNNDIGLVNTPGGHDPTDIIYTTAGEVWVAFLLNGIYKFDGNDWTEMYVVEHPTTHMKFIETSNGDFIISIDNKLYEYDNGFNELADLSIGFNYNNVKIATNEQGEMLALGGGQIAKYDAQFNPTILPILPEVETHNTLDFTTHPDGSIGFINTATGDSYYNGQIQTNTSPDFINILNPINDHLLDSYGIYWLATRHGLVKSNQGTTILYQDNNTPFISLYPLLGHVNFWAVAEDRNGDIWVSTHDKIARWERATNTWTDYLDVPRNSNDEPIGLSRIYFDEDNVLWGGTISDLVWTGTTSIGLAHFDGNTWTTYTPQNSNLESYFVHDIQEIDGGLALATQAGMSIFDGTDFTNYNRENCNIGSTHSNEIEIDGQGNIWITASIEGSTGHGGISIFNSKGIATNTQQAIENTPIPIHFFPNPTKTFFQIDTEEIPIQIQVFDLTGKLMKSITNAYIVHTDDMPSGMYAVLVQTDKQRYAGKILITK